MQKSIIFAKIQSIMIAIIGAGISGASVAYYLKKENVPFEIFEGSGRLGGCLKSEVWKDNTLEYGANSILCDGDMLQLLDDLQLDDLVVEANSISSKRYIFKDGQYQVLPTNPLKLFAGNYFTWKSKKYILADLFKKPVKLDDSVTVEAFFTQRFGKEVFNYAVQPFVSGIYAGDPAKLLMKENFPNIVEIVEKYGSVIKGFLKKGTARRRVVALKGGNDQLVKALLKNVNVQMDRRLVGLKETDQGWQLTFADQDGNKSTKTFKKVIFSIPAKPLSEVFNPIYPDLANQLARVYYPALRVDHTLLKKESKPNPNGFGVLNPHKENKKALGHIFSSSVFPDRTSGNFVITSMIGGSLGDIKHTPEEVNKEMKSALDLPDVPLEIRSYLWEQAIPQYDSTYLGLRPALSRLKHSGLYFSTNWLDGVSIPDCIKKGQKLAKLIVD
jgi:oxygen-dependent protoporphyrinogen oxidase